MQYKPHEYQSFATDFIESHPISAVFLDCGLGKTVITLTAIKRLLYESRSIKRVLIVCPLRVASNTWPEEIAKWDHLKDIKYSLVQGSPAQRRQALAENSEVVITNRENVVWLIRESGFPFDYDMVVLDELSSFKSRQANRFKALLAVRPKVKRIVGLTGTPASNGLMDLWGEFRLLDMGSRLGKFITSYRQSFFTPDKRSSQVVFSYKALPQAESEIYKRIGDITISMKSADHLKMPKLVSINTEVQMSEEEKKAYDKLKRDLVLSLGGGEVTATNAASLTGKLCQMANGAVYDDSRNTLSLHTHKLDALEDIIESSNGHSVLVAYWFVHDLERIASRLKKMKVSYCALNSSEGINAWNEGRIQVGLIHPASAGHGLNLQAGGHHLVWFSIPWSLELYQQANARLWRQGQTSKTVVIQHLVTKSSIDERIIKALDSKQLVQDALLKAVKAELGGSDENR